jgi:NAD-dependent dihydropyrimidine dehydrogenase PreA subunit
MKSVNVWNRFKGGKRMSAGIIRNIIRIDEEKCNGCGACVTACAEGALKIIEGKARLVSESYCDGLGACIGDCPQGAISIEKRQAEDFKPVMQGDCPLSSPLTDRQVPACPSTGVASFNVQAKAVPNLMEESKPSSLSHWPVQLALIPPSAPFLKGADLLLVADCVPFAYGGIHSDYINGHAVAVACPKLDDFHAHQFKLNEIMKYSDIKSLTVLRMEVPCCGGLHHMAKEAIRLSGKDIKLREVVIGVKGDVKP